MAYTGQSFVSNDSSFSSAAMLQVAATGLSISFINCTFDVAGKFLQSSYPVALSFSGCTVKLANTTSFLSLDYSGSCTSGNEGDLLISNTTFTDGSTLGSAGLSRSLINLKSIYDMKL